MDVLYHVDGPRYQLGGCNREYVREWGLARRHPFTGMGD